MRRVRAADPRSARLDVFSLEGQSKEIRHARATLVARLVAQSRILILSEHQGEKNHAALAIVMGDEEGHSAIAVALASAWNAATGPDLSRDMPEPVWVGKCRGCGHVLEAREDDANAYEAVGLMVTDRGLAVDRVPGPVALGECRCSGNGGSA